MPRAVVAGGAGFLGSHLCDRLLSDGFEVVCVDDLSTGRTQNISHLDERGDFQFVQANIAHGVDIRGDVDIIFNLASPASPIDFPTMPLHILRTGTAGTDNLLQIALKKGARFFMASTSEVYGDPEVHPQPESYVGHVNPIGPRAVYDEAKRASEAFTSAYHRTHGVDVRIARIFNTYGPRMRDNDGRVMPTFIKQAFANEPMTVFGNGSQTRSLCYVDDLVEGFVALAASSVTSPVNLGNPDELTMLELAQEIRDFLGSSSEIVFEPLPTDDPKQRRPDITKARELLNWEPRVSRKEGIGRTIAWCRDTDEFSVVGARTDATTVAS